MTSSGEHTAKLEQLQHICSQLQQHENELSTKEQQLQQEQSHSTQLTLKFEQLAETLQQRIPSGTVSRRDFAAELSAYNLQLQQLQQEIQLEKDQQRSRLTADEEDIQKSIRLLSGIELKLRTGKSFPQSPVTNKKDNDRTISELSRSIQRKELKLKEIRLLSNRSEIRSVELSPNQTVQRAQIRQLQLKARALEAHVESLRFKKEQEFKKKLEELENTPEEPIRHTDPGFIERLELQLQGLEREQQQLAEEANGCRQTIVQLHRQYDQLRKSLQQLGQQQIDSAISQKQDSRLGEIIDQNTAMQNELAFIDQTTVQLQGEFSCVHQQSQKMLASILEADKANKEELTSLSQQVAHARQLSDEMDDDLKNNYVPHEQVDEMMVLVEAEHQNLEDMPMIQKENDETRRALLNAMKQVAVFTIKPYEEIQALKKLVEERQKTIISISRSIIKMQDEIQEIRAQYGLVTDQSQPSESSLHTDRSLATESNEEAPDRLHDYPKSAPHLQNKVASAVPPRSEFTFEQYIGYAYFRHQTPKHQRILSYLLLSIFLSPSIFILLRLLLS